eukprot:scaffold1.g5760.t1
MQAAVQQIFSAAHRSGGDEGGALDEEELAWLVAAVNPDVPLCEEALGLIAGEMLAAYPSAAAARGLTLDGLRRLYAEGHADAERDFQLLMAARGADTATPPDPAKGRAQPHAGGGSPTRATSLKAGSGLTPRDLFDDLATPAPQGGAEAGDTIPSARSQQQQGAGALPATPLTARFADAFDHLATPAYPAYAAAAAQGAAAGNEPQQGAAPGNKPQQGSPAGDVFDGLMTPAAAAASVAAVAAVGCGGATVQLRSPAGDIFDGLQTPAVAAGPAVVVAAAPLQQLSPLETAAVAVSAAAAAALTVAATAPHREARSSDVFGSLQTPLHGPGAYDAHEVVGESIPAAPPVAAPQAVGQQRVGFMLDANALMESSCTAADSVIAGGSASALTPASVAKPAGQDGQLPAAAASSEAAGTLLAIAVTLPGIASSEQFVDSKQQELVDALARSLPAGSQIGIQGNAVVPTPRGLVVPLACSLPTGSAAAAASIRQQLQQTPHRIFAPQQFGCVGVVGADVDAAGSCTAALAAAMEVAVASGQPLAAATANNAQQTPTPESPRASIALSVALPQPAQPSSGAAGEQQELLIAAVQEALSCPDSSVSIKRAVVLSSGEQLVTVAADVPASAAPAAQHLHEQLGQAPGSVFKPAALAGARLVAVQHQAPLPVEPGVAAADAAVAAAECSSAIASMAPDAHALAFTLELDSQQEGTLQQELQDDLMSAIGSALPGEAQHGELCLACRGLLSARLCHALPASSLRMPSFLLAEGSAVKVAAVTPGISSTLVTMATQLPRASSDAAEQAAYVASVLQHEPQQVLSPSKFGAVRVLAMEAAHAPPPPMQQGEEDEQAMEEFTAREARQHGKRAILADAVPANPTVLLPFTLALPGLPVATVLEDGEQQQQLVAALQDALNASLTITNVTPTLNGGTLLSVAAEVPAAETAAVQEMLAQHVSQALAPALGPALVADGAAVVGTEVNAAAAQAEQATAEALHEAAADGQPALALALVAVPGSEQAIVAALQTSLPGAAIHIASSAGTADGAAALVVTAALPPTEAAAAAAVQLRQRLEQAPEEALPGVAGPVRLLQAEHAAAKLAPLLLALPVTVGDDGELSPRQQAAILAAVQQALPEGSRARIDGIKPTETGGLMAVVAAEVPAPELASGREAKKLVEELFSAAAAPDAHVNVGAVAELGDLQAACTAVQSTSSAVERAAAGGRAGVALTFALPPGSDAKRTVAAVEAQLPEGCSAQLAGDINRTLSGPLVLTISAEMPPTPAAAAQVEQFVQQLQAAPQAVLGCPAVLLAAQSRRPEFVPESWAFTLPELEAAACGEDTQQNIAAAVLAALPEGSHGVGVASIASTTNGGVLVTLMGEVPAAELPSPQQSAALVQSALAGFGSATLVPAGSEPAALVQQATSKAEADTAAAVASAGQGGRAATAVTLAVPGATTESELAEALQRLLPGASVEVVSSSLTSDGALLVTAAAALAPTAAAAEQADEALDRLLAAPAHVLALPTAGPVRVLASQQQAVDLSSLCFTLPLADQVVDKEALEASLQQALPAGTVLAATTASSADGSTAVTVQAQVPAYELEAAQQACLVLQQQFAQAALEAATRKAVAEEAARQAAEAAAAAEAAREAAEEEVVAAGVEAAAAAASGRAAPPSGIVLMSVDEFAALQQKHSKAAGASPGDVAVPAAATALAAGAVLKAGQATVSPAAPQPVAVAAASPVAAAGAAPASSSKKSGGLFNKLFRGKKAAAAAVAAEAVAPSPAPAVPAAEAAEVAAAMAVAAAVAKGQMAAAPLNLEAQMEAAALDTPSPALLGPPAPPAPPVPSTSACATANQAGVAGAIAERQQRPRCAPPPALPIATAGQALVLGASRTVSHASQATDFYTARDYHTANTSAASTPRTESTADSHPKPEAWGDLPAVSPQEGSFSFGAAFRGPAAGSVAGLALDANSTFAAGLADDGPLPSIDWSNVPPEEIEAHIARLVSDLTAVLESPESGIADIIRIQREASTLPSWAAHKAHMELGFCLNSRQRYREALYSFQAAVQVESVDPLAHFRIGNALFALKKYAEARKAYIKALKCVRSGEPGGDELAVKVYVNLGITQEAEGLLMSACDYYKQAVTLKPDHHRAFKLMGSALYALGDFEGAKAALKSSLALRPDYADAHCDLGCTYCAQGDVENAKRCFKAAIAVNPAHLEAHFNMGNLLRQCAEFERAIRSYDAVLAIDASHWRSLLNKAVVQTCTGDKDEAAFNLKLAMKLSGQGSALQTEIDQLKRMLRQGANWDVIRRAGGVGEGRESEAPGRSASRGGAEGCHPAGLRAAENRQMMSYISDKAAQVESLAATGGTGADGTPQSKASAMAGLMGSKMGKMLGRAQGALGAGSAHKGSRAKLARLGINISEAVQQVDVPMLQQLQPLAEARVADLLAEATDANISHSKRGKMIKVTKAEALVRRVLASTPPAKFQHMMRTINSQVLVLLDTKRTGYVDLALLLACLVAASDQPSWDRLQAGYRVLQWRKGSDPITRADAFDYVAALKVIFSASHDPALWSWDPTPTDGHFINEQRWGTQVSEGFPLFEALPLLAKPLA